MNKLATEKRARILGMLVEGMSMRAVSRLTGASINTVSKLLMDGGEASAAYHNEHVRGVKSARVLCHETWSFAYSKATNVERANAAAPGSGDAWTWTAFDAESKMILSWVIGNRDSMTALYLMDDVRARLVNWLQLTTDGHSAHLEAVDAAFKSEVDYAMLVKLYGDNGGQSETRYSPAECVGTWNRIVQGNPDPAKTSISDVERQDLSMRTGLRWFIRPTNALSKRIEKHAAMLALYFLHYNFCRVHKTLCCTPAMAADLGTTVRDLEWIVGLIDARAPKPNRPKTYRKRGHVSN